VSSPALSSAAQYPVLRLREHSQAAYRTSAGRSVASLVTRMMSSIVVLDLSISLLFWQNSAQAVLQLV
jgi:hypothetical protein